MKTYVPHCSSPLAESARQNEQRTQTPERASIQDQKAAGPRARRFPTIDKNDPLGAPESKYLRSFLRNTLGRGFTGPLPPSLLLNSHDQGEQLKSGLLRDHLALRIVRPNEMVFAPVDPWRGEVHLPLPPATSEEALRVNLSLLQDRCRLVRSAVMTGRSLLPSVCPTLPRVGQLRNALGTIERELYTPGTNHSGPVLSSKARMARLMQEVWRLGGCLLALPGNTDPVFLLPDVKLFLGAIQDEAARAHAYLHAIDSDEF